MRSGAGWKSTFQKAGAWSSRAPATLRIGTPRKDSTGGSGNSSRRRRENCVADSHGEIDMSEGAGQPPMARIVAFHKPPPDPEAWLKYYRDVHIPIVRKIPGVRNIRWGNVLRTTDGSPPPCWLISDVYFDNMDALETALQSDEMREAFADTSKFILDGNVQIMFCEAQDTAPLEQEELI
ncbi:MAG: EthD family reductase [Chloroflexi bacterium]|nr:MAG: EthD family reductase [Chloroflexota bacterium]